MHLLVKIISNFRSWFIDQKVNKTLKNKLKLVGCEMYRTFKLRLSLLDIGRTWSTFTWEFTGRKRKFFKLSSK